MRLHPAVTEEEALAWLRGQAEARWGEVSSDLEKQLRELAEGMAAVSAIEVPEAVEPLA